MKDIIRVEDKVKIINPEFFDRCGYDWTFEKAREEVDKLYGSKIADFIMSYNIERKEDIKIILKECAISGRTYDKVVRALAFDHLKTKMKRDSERKIFTYLEEKRKDSIATVTGIKCVQTGFYQPGYINHNAYDGDYDYISPWLEKAKTHIILRLDFYTGNFVNSYDKEHLDGLSWIEKKNVIKEEKNDKQ